MGTVNPNPVNPTPKVPLRMGESAPMPQVTSKGKKIKQVGGDQSSIPIPKAAEPTRGRSPRSSKLIKTPTVSNLLSASADVRNVSRKGDILTAPGAIATIQACFDGAFLYAYLKDAFENIISGNKSHGEVFKGMARATTGFAANADLANQDDCHLLNLTGQQWLKCFAPTGGMGHLSTDGINMRRTITANDEALINKLSEKMIFVKPPQSLIEAGYTAKDITEAFRLEKMPDELKQEWNSEWSNLFDPFGAPERRFGVAVKELTMGDLQQNNFNFSALFENGQVPEKYNNPETKIDDAFLTLLNTKPALKVAVEKIRSDKATQKGELLRAQLLQMMNFMEDNADAHFDPGRPERTSLKMASVQALSMLGQILHDHICDTRIASRGKLLHEYEQQGLIDANILKLVAEFDTKGRQNPLLAEVKNDDIKNAIANEILANQKLKRELVSILNTVKNNDNLQLSDDEISQAADQLINDYAGQIRSLPTNHKLSNPRGRVKTDFSTPAYITKHILEVRGGEEFEDKSVVTMPVGEQDKQVGEAIFEALELDESINEGLSSGPRPITLLRGGAGLDTKLVHFGYEPESSLNTALNNKFTLRKLDVSADDILSTYGGIDQVPEQLMTEPKINLNVPLTSSMIDALVAQGFPNQPSTFTGTAANGLVQVIIDSNQKIVHCKVKTDLSVSREENQRLIDEALNMARNLAESQSPVLQEGKTLRQLGFGSQESLKEAFHDSPFSFESISQTFPKELLQVPEIDLDRPLSTDQIEELSNRQMIDLTERDRLFHGLRQLYSPKETSLSLTRILPPVNPKITRLNEVLHEVIGNTQVPFNDAVRGQTISFREFSNKDSVAKIMMQNNLRTICSISGTTLDTLVGLSAVLEPDKLRDLLEPILEQAERLSNGETDVDVLPPETKKIISGIASFMQGGRYHTVAEVLGGSFIAARALFADANRNTNIEETEKLIKALMKDLSLNRKHYIYCDPETLPKIDVAVENAMLSITPTTTVSHSADLPPRW